MEEAVWIIILRLVVPLLIVRFPLGGALLAAGIDFIDFRFVGDNSWYQPADKMLDLYYLGFAAYVSLGWKDAIARKLAIGAYGFRVAGVIFFLFTQTQELLLFFPNFFESFFIFYLLYVKLSNNSVLFTSKRVVVIVTAALLIPKLFQEYALHVHLLSPALTPDWVAAVIEAPMAMAVLAWLALPVAALIWYTVESRRKYSAKV